MNRRVYIVVLGAVVVSAFLGFLAPARSLLPAVVFWGAVVQGALALAAAGELTRARWIEPIRDALLQLHPVLLIFPCAFLILARDLGAFPWTAAPTRWLQPGFFVARTVLLHLLTWLLAALFARAATRGSPRAGILAGLYALVFVITQSLVAFDWVMSLEYPWVSTLFGGYFFVEALYLGIAVAALGAAARVSQRREAPRETLRDAATLLFGFSLLWAGQFFAQYLVIWYGNLPHEVGYLARRLTATPLRGLSTLVLGTLFVVPFLVLLSRSAKTSPRVVSAMAILVGAGVFLERLVMLLPVLELSAWVVVISNLLIGGIVIRTLAGALIRETR